MNARINFFCLGSNEWRLCHFTVEVLAQPKLGLLDSYGIDCKSGELGHSV
jgi:hypothetical protein